MTGSSTPREIGIVLYPGVQMAAVHGLTDLFRIANRLSAENLRDGAAPLRVSHWSAGNGDVSCVYRSEPSAEACPGILIFPPTLGELPAPGGGAAMGRWLLQQHSRGVTLVTICSGVFVLAGTGLLDGRAVSTHRMCAQALVDRFPNIIVDAEIPMVEHPGILTAGGFLAWVDVALVLIGRLLGDAVQAATARFVLDGRSTGPRPYFKGFTPRQTHGDAAVRRAQELVHLRDGQDISLAAMAAAAGLARRTFLRRFVSATGMTPIDYCRAVRIGRARELLEDGNMPIKEIADMLGYVDVSSFARAFRRVYGMPPRTYRRLHGGEIAENVANLAAAPVSASFNRTALEL